MKKKIIIIISAANQDTVLKFLTAVIQVFMLLLVHTYNFIDSRKKIIVFQNLNFLIYIFFLQ